MINKTAVAVPGGLGPQGGFPSEQTLVEGVCTASGYTFSTRQDANNPDAQALSVLPKGVLRVVSSSFTVSPSYFGMHFHRYPIGSTTTIRPQPFTYAKVRSHDGFRLRWQSIETSKGVFDWSGFDAWVNTHTANGTEMIFTLFGTPAWASTRPTEDNPYSIPGLVAEPTNMQDWSDFCTAVATRAAGRIKNWEVWNEPQSLKFFSGSQSSLSQMTRRAYQAIKAVMPSANMLCPSVTGWQPYPNSDAEQYFVGMMNASDGAAGTLKDWFDTCAVHLYSPGISAGLPNMVDRVNAALTAVGKAGKPIWDTESGILSPFPSFISAARRRKLFAEQVVLPAAKGVAVSCWYAYDNLDMGFMQDPDFYAFREQLLADLVAGPVTNVVQYYGETQFTANGKRYVFN